MKRSFVNALFSLLLLAAAPLSGQSTATITGRISNPAGQPEAAVLVRIEALNVGTSSGADGSYRLVVPGARFTDGQTVTLTASRVGLTPVSRTISLHHDSQLTQNYQMSASVLKLEDLVVTGTVGTVQARVAPAAVAQVAAAENF